MFKNLGEDIFNLNFFGSPASVQRFALPFNSRVSSKDFEKPLKGATIVSNETLGHQGITLYRAKMVLTARK